MVTLILIIPKWGLLMISKNINDNKNRIRYLFGNSSDLVFHQFETLSETGAMVVYINGLVDKSALNDSIIRPLLEDLISPYDIKSTIYISEIKEAKTLKDAVDSIIDGHVLLFFENFDYAFIMNICRYEKRSIQESSSEQVIRGPKESFIEDLYVNRTLIRRKIRNQNLIFEDYIFGRQTNTKVSICYIKGIVNDEILAELKARLNTIDIDGVIDSHYIEEHIEDAPRSLVATIYDTEKPDVVVGKLLEGRIGIICDGSPVVLTLPRLFIEDLMTAEDYYLRPQFATYLRVMRVVAFFASMMLIGTYIAIATFHQEMIPTKLLLSIATQREGVPLPAFLEGVLMLIFFEFLKEAGLRLPKPINTTVALVGGLVIGQASVDAGLVSGFMIIVVAASGITEFVNLQLRELVVLYRFVFLFLGALFGLYGISSGSIILIFHLVSIKSFGVPFMYPLAPYDKEGMKDFMRRSPLKKYNYRPKYISSKDARKRSADNEE
ncbi:spore germination protein [Tissierella creatinini]|nr:spore germination protein [Tissierella creatinini]TJX66669.1 spore germination protein [Soehngenia saccharolytica]